MTAHKIHKEGGFWPTEKQLLLLKAALFSPKEGLAYWTEWLKQQQISESDLSSPDFLEKLFDPIDVGSERMMPLIHANLSGMGNPFIERLQGHRRKTWMRNSYLQHHIVEILKAFDQASIEHLLLKGIPLANCYYKDLSLRPMGDVDLMIRPRDQKKAIEMLLAPPFNAKLKYGKKQLIDPKSATLLLSNDMEIDLHWHLFREQSAIHEIDDVFWENKEPFALLNISAYMLSPTYLLFHVMVHGRRYDQGVPPFRWVADCMLINRQHPIDWNIVIQLGIKYKYIPFMKMAIALLHDTFGVNIPQESIQRIASLKPSATEETFQKIISLELFQAKSLLGEIINKIRFRYYEYIVFRREYNPNGIAWFWQKFIIALKNRV